MAATDIETHDGANVAGASKRFVAKRLLKRVSEHDLLLIAAGITFYMLLALAPGLSALVSLYGLVADPATAIEHMALLEGIVPAGGIEVVREQLERLTSGDRGTLGLAFAISILLALWSANAGMKALFRGMNVAYEVEEERSIVKFTAQSLAFTLAALLVGIVFIALIVVLPAVLSAIGLPGGTEWLVRLLSLAIFFALLSVGISALYLWGPCRPDGHWHWLTPGTILAVVLMLAVSIIFSWYVANFGNYNATYGSLGAIVGFLTWVWLTTTTLLLGGELNSILNRMKQPHTPELG